MLHLIYRRLLSALAAGSRKLDFQEETRCTETKRIVHSAARRGVAASPMTEAESVSIEIWLLIPLGVRHLKVRRRRYSAEAARSEANVCSTGV